MQSGRAFKISYKRSYDGGYRYCSRCGCYYLTDGNRCPRCGTLLRSSPRRKTQWKKAESIKVVRITPDLEKELEKIEVKVRVKSA